MTNQTDSESYSALTKRLQKLERDNRTMKRVGAVVLVATAALIFMGQTGKNRALDADSLVIRDASGRVRMEVGTSEDNSPILRMFGGSDNKNASLLLSSDKNGSGLTILGPGRGLAMLTNTNEPTLLLADGTGGTAVDIASVHVYDQDRNHRHQEWKHDEDLRRLNHAFR